MLRKIADVMATKEAGAAFNVLQGGLLAAEGAHVMYNGSSSGAWLLASGVSHIAITIGEYALLDASYRQSKLHPPANDAKGLS